MLKGVPVVSVEPAAGENAPGDATADVFVGSVGVPPPHPAHAPSRAQRAVAAVAYRRVTQTSDERTSRRKDGQ
jgi:hypothetical protein